MSWPLYHYVISLFVFNYIFHFRVYFVWYEYCYPVLLLFPFSWNTFFYSLTLSLCMFLALKWVSSRQHIGGSWFFFNPISHLLSFYWGINPFSFKVIPDRYVLCIAILLLVFWCFFFLYFFSLIFLVSFCVA